MSWLAPLFLAGLAAIALPIWLHRLQTETPKRQSFSSTMLLLQAERRMHVEKRLRYWLLLALRILFLGLLALAFAKPLWERPPAALNAAQAKLQVLVLDASMSIQQEQRWTAVINQAQQVIAAAGAADRLQLLTAADELQVIAGPFNATADGKNKLRSALDKLKPGAGQLQYGAMMNGLEALLADEKQSTVIHVISDFQASGLPAQFGDLVPREVNGRVTQVQLHPVNAALTANWSISGVERTGNGIEVTVQGYHTQAVNLTVQLLVNGSQRAEQNKAISASGSTVFEFAKVALNTGSNKIEARIKSPDSLAADDVFYTVLENSVGQPVPFLSMTPAALPAKYLDAAFVAAGNRHELKPMRMDQFDARTLPRYRFVIIDDLGAVNATLASALNDYVQGGGAVLAAVGERSLTSTTLPLVNLAVSNPRDQSERFTVGAIDINHPALSRAAGLRSLNVSRYLAVSADTQSRALVQLDNGAPLLLEQVRGEGRVLLLSSALDNTWNDLPVQPVFVSLVSEAARYLAGETRLKREQHVGSNLALDQAVGQVIDPAGGELLALADAQRGRSIKLETQGFYEVVSAAGSNLIAVNAVPAESDLLPMSQDEIANWQAALARQPQTVAASTASSETKGGLELWHGLLILMVLAVLAESLLGNTYVSRRVEVPT